MLYLRHQSGRAGDECSHEQLETRASGVRGHCVLCAFLLCSFGRAVSSMSYLVPSGLFLVLPFSVPGRPRLEQALFVPDQTAQPLPETVGCGRWAPCAASAPLLRPGLLSSTRSPAIEAVRWAPWARPPSLQPRAAFSGRRAVSQPSICLHWHSPQQKFLKVGGIPMAFFPIFQCRSRSPLFLYSLGPFCHLQKEVA